MMQDAHQANHQPSAEYDGPSKSQVKREMHALLELGRRLVALPAAKLAQLPLDEKLADAISLAQRTRSREGQRRQIHYVGKLMRQADSKAIQAQLAYWDSGAQAQTRSMQRLEALRDKLIVDDAALTELLNLVEPLDVQALRAEIRAARQEQRHNATLAPGHEPLRKHYRALFQALKQLQFKDELYE